MIRLSRAQVREIDRLSVEQYHIPGVVLMENAARGATEVALEMIGRSSQGRALIVCGGGNNGGDGLAVARHLHNHGINVEILLAADPLKYAGEAKVNWEIVQAMNLPVGPADLAALQIRKPDLIVDAIFGTGLREPPREPFARIVAAVERVGAPILAIDIPSGLDCDTGRPLGPACVKAKKTVTFVAEKIGFAEPGAKEFLGEVIVAEIGCPRELVERV
jgi:NAD(P)H-hydrate epimerase